MSGGSSGIFQWSRHCPPGASGSGAYGGGGHAGGGGFVGGRARSSGPGITNADAARMVEEATAAELKSRGIKVPTYADKPMSQAAVFWAGFLAGLMTGLFIGLVFWELT